ncbi:MAG: hypothetical protein Q9169_006518 [Polycauliona sp. 2 TL-2023]
MSVGSTWLRPQGLASASSRDSTIEPTACDVCAKIIQSFSIPVGEEAEIPLGNLASLLVGECPHVDMFRNLKLCHRRAPRYEEQEVVLWRCGSSFTTATRFACSYWEKGHRVRTSSAGLELVARHDIQNHPGRALMLDSHWFSDGIIQEWISTCDRLHGDRCKTLPLMVNDDQVQPRFLIDTLRNCVVESKGFGSEYVALSYTWGRTQNLRNELAICQELQIPGILSQEKYRQRLPLTIRDAMAVVLRLGYRYLWVDSLCIVQDDEQHLRHELNQMHQVYAGATFTLIAADGVDANHGLRGFRDLTAPRHLQQQPIKLAAGESIVQDVRSRTTGDVAVLLPGKAYYNRAWTFQENLFSKRRVIFEDNSVRWRCQCTDWDEDLIPDSRVDERDGDTWDLPGKYHGESWLHSSVPTLSILSDTIRTYNTKILTYPEDALSAFAGIQAMLHRMYPGGLTYGMPENFFDIALMWRPSWPITRRQASTKSHSHKLLSWSWLGWAGSVSFPTDLEFEIAPGVGLIGIEGYTMPVTDWYTMSSPRSTERRRIRPTWYHNKRFAAENADNILLGWRREPYDTEGRFHVEKSKIGYQYPRPPGYCYRHSSSRHESQFQWYPIPVLDGSEPRLLQPQTAFLYAQTSRAFFHTGSLVDEKEDPHLGTPRVRLVKADGQQIGLLQLNNLSDLTNLETDPVSKIGKRVELVATCKGYTGRIFDYELAKRIAENTGETSWASQLKDCYFVLWIEWEDGIAYRQGCGAVTVDAWERERDDDFVDLILG